MTPKQRLTEPQAWRLIAERIEKGLWAGSGICEEINRQYLISHELRRAMHLRLHEHLWMQSNRRTPWYAEPVDDREPRLCYTPTWPDYFPRVWLVPPGIRTPRIMACELLALEAESEGL